MADRPASRAKYGTPLLNRRAMLVGGAAMLGVPGAVYGAAWLSLDSSTLARALIWGFPDVDDYKRFPARTIAAGQEPYRYETGAGYPDSLPASFPPGHDDLATTLAQSLTTAFIVVRDERLIYERYFNGHDRQSIQTSFSVAKSFTSALIGCAIADGLIGNVGDPVTKYIPELRQRDQRFTQITIRHLLSMASGLRFWRSRKPWGDNTKTYYAPDLRKLALEATEIVELPGRQFHYNDFNTVLIGIVLERVTGMSVSAYLSEKIWKPIGAEANATWSLDSNKSGFEKMASGINARAIDFAKFGSLYLARGSWRGQQVLSAEWVDQSTRYSDGTDPSLMYQYAWWTFRSEGLGDYFVASGSLGQFIFVFPNQRLVIVRNGINGGGIDWMAAVPAIVLQVADGGSRRR